MKHKAVFFIGVFFLFGFLEALAQRSPKVDSTLRSINENRVFQKDLRIKIKWFYVEITEPIKLSDKSREMKTAYKDYLVGRVNYATDPAFVLVDSKHSDKKIYLRKETYNAFIEMYNDAQKVGIELLIISGGRNFAYQRGIWERKWNDLPDLSSRERAKNILQYSSMPMSSRHHWATDIDLNNLENEFFESGRGLKIYEWLKKNGPKYGFCQVYTDKSKSGRKGYEMEKWHWSYMPISKQLLKDYNSMINIEDIKGFKGSEVAAETNIIKDYVNGVTECE